MPKVSKREEKRLKNLNFLRQVLELKSELFGQFSPIITKETRKKAWMEVRDYAVSIGLVGHEKDFSYVRDATWPNLRNRTMMKIDQCKKTGEPGNPDSKLDDSDKLVIEIIGKESPVVHGIGVSDSIEENVVSEMEESIQIGTTNLVECTSSEGKLNNNPFKSTVHGGSFKGLRKKRVAVLQTEDTNFIQHLKINKLRLEVRKLELEVWEKERALHVEHSPLTAHIETSNSNNNDTTQVNDIETVNNAEYVFNDEGQFFMLQQNTA